MTENNIVETSSAATGSTYFQEQITFPGIVISTLTNGFVSIFAFLSAREKKTVRCRTYLTNGSQFT